MKIIIGLGNPGNKYAKTRHNIGFRVVDALAHELGLQFRQNNKFVAEVAEGKNLILAKPLTFMNESGRAVLPLLTTYHLQLPDLLIVHDEIDLPLGKLRVSENSGAAGHHGIESIIAAIGQDFTRLRVGIDGRESRTHVATEGYVLQNFTAEEEKKLAEDIIPQAMQQIKNSAL